MAAELVQGLVSSTSRVSYFLLETLLSQEFASYHSLVSQLANEGEEDIVQILRNQFQFQTNVDQITVRTWHIPLTMPHYW